MLNTTTTKDCYGIEYQTLEFECILILYIYFEYVHLVHMKRNVLYAITTAAAVVAATAAAAVAVAPQHHFILAKMWRLRLNV